MEPRHDLRRGENEAWDDLIESLNRSAFALIRRRRCSVTELSLANGLPSTTLSCRCILRPLARHLLSTDTNEFGKLAICSPES